MFLTLALFIAPAPPAPPVLYAYPGLGGKPGAEASFTLKGEHLKQANALYLNDRKLDAKFGKVDHDLANVSFIVPPLAVGPHRLRLATKNGISNPRVFVVEDLKIEEAKPERTKKETAHAVTGSCSIIAKSSTEASDYYRMAVKAGQTVTFEVVGTRLGSAIDPVLIVHDAKSFRELPGLYADDSPGLQSDCRLTHTFKADAEIIVEVRDTTWRGNLEYRLRIGDFPSFVYANPLAVEKSHDVTLVGEKATYPRRLAVPGLLCTESGGWGVSLGKSEIPVLAAPTSKETQICTPPFAVTARFAAKDERHDFAMNLKKGQKIRAVALVQEFGLLTEVLLEVLDSSGKSLVKSDPMNLPAAIDFDAPADGRYLLRAEHLNYGYGNLEAYHLTVTPRVPDAIVYLSTDALTLPGTLKATSILRFEKHEAEIPLEWIGDPAIRVKTVIPKKANPTAASPLLIALEAAPGTKPGVYFGHIKSRAGASPRICSTREATKAIYPGLIAPPTEGDGTIIVVVPER